MKYARSLDGLRNFVSDDRISENATVAYEGWKRITHDVTVRGIQFQYAQANPDVYSQVDK